MRVCGFLYFGGEIIKFVDFLNNNSLKSIRREGEGFIDFIDKIFKNNFDCLGFMKFGEIEGGLYSPSNAYPERLYKIRPVKENEILIIRRDLFHIPFNKKKIGNGRYDNIKDYLCIYMGNSIKVCICISNISSMFYESS